MVELLVAMLLGLFLLYALIEILINGKQSFGSANNLSRLQENGRIATNLVVSDLKRAGYMGGNSDVPNIYGSADQERLPADCDTIGAVGGTAWARSVGESVYGEDDGFFAYPCISSLAYLRGDVITVRYASPQIAGALSPNKMYLRSSLFEGKIFAGSDAALAVNTVMDQPQTERELVAHAYFVGNGDFRCGQRVPTLYRMSLDDNSRPEMNSLLPGVEDFQVQYGDNGRYQDADGVSSWDNITTVRIWILVRADCPETGFTDGNTYVYGDQVYTPNDSYRRQLYSSVVMIRN